MSKNAIKTPSPVKRLVDIIIWNAFYIFCLNIPCIPRIVISRTPRIFFGIFHLEIFTLKLSNKIITCGRFHLSIYKKQTVEHLIPTLKSFYSSINYFPVNLNLLLNSGIIYTRFSPGATTVANTQSPFLFSTDFELP